ncbi:MAG: hypothetical protein ACM3U2_03800 [Deltaproteobacteria bacterium]
MSEGLMFREEELLRTAAPLPVLSSGLRPRVLAAAAEARARRSHGRRVLAGAAVVFMLLGWLAWSGPFLPPASQLAGMNSTPRDGFALGGETSAAAPTASSPYGRRERFIAAMADDWRMVEAEFQSREEFTRRVQM